MIGFFYFHYLASFFKINFSCVCFFPMACYETLVLTLQYSLYKILFSFSNEVPSCTMPSDFRSKPGPMRRERPKNLGAKKF